MPDADTSDFEVHASGSIDLTAGSVTISLASVSIDGQTYDFSDSDLRVMLDEATVDPED